MGIGGKPKRERTHSEHRFLELSSKFCQNWLRLPLTGRFLSPPHLSTDGVGALRKAWVLIRLCKQLNIASKHARRREARPPRVDPNTKKVQENAYQCYYDTDTQCANFRGNPLRKATKRHLTVKNDEK